jgi:tetratricopeptide (TPR) repeat protein
MRPVLPRRVWLPLAIFAGVSAGCARNAAAPRQPATLSTLEAARRVHYLIAASVTGDPTSLGPPGTTDQLRQWLGQYLAQVGLPPASNPPGPGDVELRLSLSARGGSVLLYGTAALVAVANGQVIDQWSTSEHVEPATSFSRALARELVEALVHSPRLATYADAASGGRTPSGAPPSGVTMTAMLAPSPPPPPEGSVTPPPVGSGPPSGSAPADPAGSSTAAARAHARQGLALYDLKRFQEAFNEFEQAYLIEQDPALLYDMAQCQRKLGNNEEALHFYRTYLRRVPKGPSAVEAEKRAKEIEDAMNRAKRTSAP